LLIQYFYEGLSITDRNMLDAASGGALMNKTPTAARELIANMAANSQQFGTRGILQRPAQEEGTDSLQAQFKELTSVVRQLDVGQASRVRPCSLCETVNHTTEDCPWTVNTTEAHAKAVVANN
ncbi:Unknown protein, partial [Striga hermonthica]